MNAITVISANDVWAVGSSVYQNGVQQTLAEHWNVSSWSIVPSPNPSGLTVSYLAGVSASSSNDVWAVGYALQTDGSNAQALIEHWDGSSWSVIPSPTPPSIYDTFLYGVTAASASKVWTVGNYSTNSQIGQTLIEFYC